MFRKRLSTIANLSRIVYLSVFLGIALPGAVAWTLLVLPTRPATWVSITVPLAVGVAIALLANAVDQIVERRAEQKTAARAKGAAS
ncbi:hypothetical protein [Streptomyces sp. LN500]|uniref:hypothetical protein n=1 Tax=Streptomyces sp. LN500 TaxID=3112978 RepID=UPI003717E747